MSCLGRQADLSGVQKERRRSRDLLCQGACRRAALLQGKAADRSAVRCQQGIGARRQGGRRNCKGSRQARAAIAGGAAAVDLGHHGYSRSTEARRSEDRRTEEGGRCAGTVEFDRHRSCELPLQARAGPRSAGALRCAGGRRSGGHPRQEQRLQERGQPLRKPAIAAFEGCR